MTTEPKTNLAFTWSSVYHPQWDNDPARYVEEGVVQWGRSRRLARAEDAAHSFKAYLGIQHYDPGRWYGAGAGDARATFFLSLFLHRRTVSLQTYPTMAAVLAALWAFHASLSQPSPG
jgi:hypothetical protein